MEHQEFDRQIRQSLEQLETHTSPSAQASWETLAQRLDEEIIPETNPEEEFDDAIREKLEHTTPSTIPASNWLQLSNRLDVQEEQIAWIYRHKTAESTLLLLLLLAFSNIINIPQVKLQALAAPLLGHRSVSTKNTNNITSQLNEVTIAASYNDVYNMMGTEIVTENGLSAASQTPITAMRRAPMSVIKKLDSKIIAPLTVVTPIVKSTYITETEKLPLLKANEINSDFEERKRNAFYLYVMPALRKSHTSVSFVATADLNTVQTPSEMFLGEKIEAYDKKTISAGGGFLLAREYKHSAVEVGFLYTSKRYTPNPITYSGSINGIKYKETLRKVQINMLDIPVSFRYAFAKDEKSSFYATVGSSLHIITQANYDSERQFSNSLALKSLSPDEQIPSTINSVKKFDAGLFEGGVMQENLFITAHAGFGMEHKLSNRISCFGQTIYQRHLAIEGIGANRNYIHSMSFWGGLKTHF